METIQGIRGDATAYGGCFSLAVCPVGMAAAPYSGKRLDTTDRYVREGR